MPVAKAMRPDGTSNPLHIGNETYAITTRTTRRDDFRRGAAIVGPSPGTSAELCDQSNAIGSRGRKVSREHTVMWEMPRDSQSPLQALGLEPAVGAYVAVRHKS
jgi:hypothetical protein